MQYIITYFNQFEKYAHDEVRDIDPQAKITPMTEALAMVETNLTKEAFNEQLIKSDPVFIRHIQPVDMALELIDASPEKNLEALRDAAASIHKLTDNAPFCVQCRKISSDLPFKAKDVEVLVGSSLEEQGYRPVFSDTKIQNEDVPVISILILGCRGYVGFSHAIENLNAQSDEYRVASRTGRQISRAENKLIEAIEKFNIAIDGQGLALDIGAAPGGWTRVLADYGFEVLAVDPGRLHESLYEVPNIKHIPKRVELVAFDRPLQLIVNDMNIDPQESAKMMCTLAYLLSPGSRAIITLKLPFANVPKSLEESKAILEECYDILHIKNLSHNRREVTVDMVRK